MDLTLMVRFAPKYWVHAVVLQLPTEATFHMTVPAVVTSDNWFMKSVHFIPCAVRHSITNGHICTVGSQMVTACRTHCNYAVMNTVHMAQSHSGINGDSAFCVVLVEKKKKKKKWKMKARCPGGYSKKKKKLKWQPVEPPVCSRQRLPLNLLQTYTTSM